MLSETERTLMDNTITFEEIMKYHPDNQTVFCEIQQGIQRLTPFVGAGMSVPFGYPCWADYLAHLNSKVLEKDVREKIKALLTGSSVHRYEDAAQLLSEYRGAQNFRADIMAEFGKEPISSCEFESTALYMLPLLFQGLVLTTNYDKMLETVYYMHGCPFDAVAHPGHHELLNASLSGFSKNILFKLHGDISEGTSLILTGSSYNQAYDPNTDLVQTLKKCFAQTRLLFLGCSLGEDRTMEVLHTILEPGIMHYAFCSCKKEERSAQIRRLDRLGIRAVLFPNKKYDSIRVLLSKSAENTIQKNVNPFQNKAGIPSRFEHPFRTESMIDYFRHAYKRLYNAIGSFYLLHLNKGIFPGLKGQEIQVTPEGEKNTFPLKEFLLKMWAKDITNPLLLLGEGGSGKTTALLQTCRNFLDDGMPASFIPVNELGAGGVRDYLLHNLWDTDIEKEKTFYSFLRKSTRNSRPAWLLCLDGFNEADEKTREGICGFVREWLDCPNIQIILSSRFEKLPNYGFSQFRQVTIQPLEAFQIENYLAECGLTMPKEYNGLTELLSLPLMLTLYTQTEYVQTRFQDSDFLYYRNPPVHSERTVWTTGIVIWNFMQCQVGKVLSSHTSLEEKLAYIVALEYVCPFICWMMEKEGLFHIEETVFLNWTKSAVTMLQQSWDSEKPLRIRRLESIFPALQSCSISSPQKICFLLTRRLHIFNCYEKRFGLIHHHFRDCLTAVHLINEAEIHGSYADAWTHYAISRNVLRFLHDLMTPETFKHIWATLKGRRIAIDDYSLYNAAELIKCDKDCLSRINFSRMDLRRVRLGGFSFSQTGHTASFSGAQIGKYTFNTDTFHSSVSYISFSPDGRYMVSGSADEILIWNTADWFPIRRIPADISIHPTAAALLPGSEKILVADDTCSVSLWQIAGEICLGTMRGHTDLICHVQISSDGSTGVTSSEDNTAIVWDLNSYKQQCVLRGHSGKVCSAHFSADNAFILTVSLDQTLKIWNRTGTCLYTLKGHHAEITAAAWLPDGSSCLSGDAQGEVRLWDIKTGEYFPLKSCDYSVVSLCVSKDGQYCLVGKKCANRYIWDLKQKTYKKITIKKYLNFTDALIEAFFSPDEKTCYNAFSGLPLFEYDLQTGCVTDHEMTYHIYIKTCISPDRSHIAYFDTDRLDIHELNTKKHITLFEQNSRYAGFTGDGTRIAILTKSSRNIRYIDAQAIIAEDKLKICDIIPCEHNLSFNSFSRDGKYCITGTKERTMELWNAPSFQKLGVIYVPLSNKKAAADYPPFCCFQPLGNTGTCVAGTEAGDLQLWDFHTHTCIFSLKLGVGPYNYISPVRCVACSTDNRLCLAGVEDKVYQINLDTVTIEHIYQHKGEIITIAWSVNDRYFVVSCKDQTIYCWYPETGECAWNIGKRINRLYQCDCFKDGRHILLRSSDGSLRTLSLPDCRTQDMSLYPNITFGSALMPDGIRCLLWNADSVSIWNLQTKQTEKYFDGKGDSSSNHNYFIADQAVLSPDGDKCFIMEKLGRIKCLDLATGIVTNITDDMYDIFGSTGWTIFPTDLAVSPDCRFLVPSCTGHRSYIYDLKYNRGTELYTNGCTVMTAAFSPDGQYMAGGSGHGDVFLWNPHDLKYGYYIHDFIGHRSNVTHVMFSTDSKKLISASKDGTICVWRISDYQCENTLQTGSSIEDIKLLQDNIHCICIAKSGTCLSIWNLLSNECHKEIRLLHELNIVDCDFSESEFEDTDIKDMVYWSGGRTS